MVLSNDGDTAWNEDLAVSWMLVRVPLWLGSSLEVEVLARGDVRSLVKWDFVGCGGFGERFLEEIFDLLAQTLLLFELSFRIGLRESFDRTDVEWY